MNRLFDFLRRFLYGRYGNDALGFATLIGYLILSILSSALNNLILMIPAVRAGRPGMANTPRTMRCGITPSWYLHCTQAGPCLSSITRSQNRVSPFFPP